MTLLKNIVEYVDAIAPLSSQAQWDNSGLLISDTNAQINKALLCLDITEDVINEAVKLECELIISHHPVIFSPLSSITNDSIVYKLIKNGLNALCLHTNLDIAEKIGVNVCLANALDLSDTTLYPEDFLCVGKLKKKMSDTEFASRYHSWIDSGDLQSAGIIDARKLTEIPVRQSGIIPVQP